MRERGRGRQHNGCADAKTDPVKPPLIIWHGHSVFFSFLLVVIEFVEISMIENAEQVGIGFGVRLSSVLICSQPVSVSLCFQTD